MSIAASLKSLLPEPKGGDGRQQSPEEAQKGTGPSASVIKKLKEQSVKVPGYGERDDWVPRTAEDYGDGGAYPEVHVPQFPLEMGRNVQRALIGRKQGGVVSTMTDADGRTRFDAAVMQAHAPGAVVHARPSSLVGRRYTDEEMERPSQAEVEDNVERTKKAIQAKLGAVLVETNASRPNPAISAPSETQIVQYTAATSGAGDASGASKRLVKIVEKKVDPLEPPKFRVQKSATLLETEAAVPVLHDAPKKMTKEEAEAWVIPASFSNWNSRGFTIGLDKRELAAHAAQGTETPISGKFSTMAAALDTAQQSAREQVAYRARLEQQKQLQQRELEDQQVREVARQARLRRAGIIADAAGIETEDDRQARLARDAVREDLRRDREDEMRRERMGKGAKQSAAASSSTVGASQGSGSGSRDISERIALGQTVPRQQEVMYDSRLFGQSQGLDHGFVNDEEYNLYDKPLLSTGREEALFRGLNQREGEVYQEEFTIDRLKPTSGGGDFKADKPFAGAERGSRSRTSGPVEFERDEESAHAQRMEEIERQKSLAHQARPAPDSRDQRGHRDSREDMGEIRGRDARDGEEMRRDFRGPRSDSREERYPSPPRRRGDSPPRTGRYPSPPRRGRGEYPSPPRRRSSPNRGPGPESDDPMDAMMSFMSDAKSSRKRERPEVDEFGRSSRGPTLGHMHAVGGSSGSVEDYRGSQRSKVAFVPSRAGDDAPHRIEEEERRRDADREGPGRDYGRSRHDHPRERDGDRRGDRGDRRY